MTPVPIPSQLTPQTDKHPHSALHTHHAPRPAPTHTNHQPPTTATITVTVGHSPRCPDLPCPALPPDTPYPSAETAIPPQHHTTPYRDAQILPHHIHHAMATTPIPFHSMPNNQQQPIRIHTHTQTPLKAMPPTTHHKQYAHAATTHTPRIDKRHQGRAMLQSASLTKNKKRTKRKNLLLLALHRLDRAGWLTAWSFASQVFTTSRRSVVVLRNTWFEIDKKIKVKMDIDLHIGPEGQILDHEFS